MARKKKTSSLVIGIVGMPASGKTVVAEHLAKKKNALRVHTGDFIWQYLRKRGIKPTKETGMMAALYMWVEYGDMPVVDWVIKQIKKARGKKLVIVDALRTMEEAQQFQLRLGDKFHVISVLAGPETRLVRQKKRARFGKVSKLEFRMRDREELRTGVGDLIASSCHYIDGNKSMADVKKQADALIKRLR